MDTTKDNTVKVKECEFYSRQLTMWMQEEPVVAAENGLNEDLIGSKSSLKGLSFA